MPRKKGSSIKTNKKKNLKSVNNARKSPPYKSSPSKQKITQTKSTKGQSTKPKRITKRNCKQDLLMNSLVEFFSKKINIKVILPIIESKSNISLRLIDWFVTNYCKKNTVRYYVKKKDNSRKQFDVHLNYKTQLKSFSKKQFDPFRRDERIEFAYDTKKGEEPGILITTVGQLNFFRWVIRNDILKYISKNYDSIEKDMNTITKKNRQKTEKSKKINKTGEINNRKRRQLCVSATKSINKHTAKFTITFN
jgi:hypothetical protein